MAWCLIGVANTLGIADGDLIKLPRSHASRPTLTRPVRFVARKSMFAQALVRSFYAEASAHAAAMDVDQEPHPGVSTQAAPRQSLARPLTHKGSAFRQGTK